VSDGAAEPLRSPHRPSNVTLKPFLVAAFVALAATGCSDRSTSAAGSGSCAFVAHFRGQTYDGTTVEVAPVVGRTVGIARVPGCSDTGTGSPKAPERLRVAQVAGVSTTVALAVVGQEHTILVRAG